MKTYTEKMSTSLSKIKLRAVEKVVGYNLVTVSNNSAQSKTISIYHSLLPWIHVMYLSNIQADCFKGAVDTRGRACDQFSFRSLSDRFS